MGHSGFRKADVPGSPRFLEEQSGDKVYSLKEYRICAALIHVRVLRMDRLASIDLFIRVVETGSFSKAAESLGIAQPTATKAVAAIEQRLGARLLHRSTRGITPTEVGALYYGKCKHISSDVEDAENLAALVQGGVGGQIRISTPLAFGRMILTPLAMRYMNENPSIRIDLGMDDRFVDLVEDGIDVAIRMGRLAASTFGARFLGVMHWVIVASPDYLAQHSAPQVPSDLSQHPCVIYSNMQGEDHWTFTGPTGEEMSVQVHGRLRTNNKSAIFEATCQGFGVAMLPWYLVRQAIADGALQRVLEDHALPSHDIHAVYPSPKLVSKKTTHFIEFLQHSLMGEWWASGGR